MIRKLEHKPYLLLVGGLPATGKTWFARALAAKLGIAHINSDTLRAELNLRGQYDPASKQRVYDSMFERGERLLKDGQSLIVDSTFYLQRLRQPWVLLAQKYELSYFFIEITAPEEIAMERLRQPRPDSEADQEVYRLLKASWEEIELPHLVLDAGRLSPDEMLTQTAQFIQENYDAGTD